MAPKTLCEATSEIKMAQQSTGLSRPKYTALQQQDVCPSTTDEPYTKLSVKVRYSVTTRVKACFIFTRIARECPNDEQHSHSSHSVLALWLFSHISFFHLESFFWQYWQSLKMTAASRSKSPSYKPQAEPGMALPGTVLQLAAPHTWMFLSPSDLLENSPVWQCLLIQPVPALPLLPQWKQAASDSSNVSELLVLEEHTRTQEWEVKTKKTPTN